MRRRAWIMNALMTRWNCEPWYPYPSLPVHSAFQLCAVLGTIPPNRPISTRPKTSSPRVTSIQSTSAARPGSGAAAGAGRVAPRTRL